MSPPWPQVRLGDVVQHRKHFVRIDDLAEYKRCRVQLHAQGIVLRDRVPGAEIKTKAQQVCRTGDFLVAEIDAKMGGFGIVPQALDGAIVSSHYFLFEINDRKLDREFLDWYCKTPAFREQVNAQGTTNYAAIRPAHVLGYTIPLPPLSEQRRIGARLNAGSALIREAQDLRNTLDTARKSLCISAKTPLLSANALSKWQSMPLGEVCEVQSGVTLGRQISGPTISVPYLRVANVQDGRLDLTTIKNVVIRPDELHKWLLRPGDILLTEGGDWDKLGRGTVWRGEIGDCIHQNHIFRLRVDSSQFLPEFLSALLGSAYGRQYFQDASKQTTNLASINQRQLKAFTVFQPPVTEQRRIIDLCGAIDAALIRAATVSEQAAARVNAMTPSLLARAFAGEP